MSEKMATIVEKNNKLKQILQAAQNLAARNTTTTKSPPKPPIVLLCTGDLLAAINKLLATLKKDGYTMNQIEQTQMSSRFNFGCSSAKAQGEAAKLQAEGQKIAGGVMMITGGLMIGAGVACAGMSMASTAESNGVKIVGSRGSEEVAGGLGRFEGEAIPARDDGAGVGQGITEDLGSGGGSEALRARDESLARREGPAGDIEMTEYPRPGGDSEPQPVDGNAQVRSEEEGPSNGNEITNEEQKKAAQEKIQKKWNQKIQIVNGAIMGISAGGQGVSTYNTGIYGDMSGTRQAISGVQGTCKDSMDSAQRSTNTTQQGAAQSFGTLSSGTTQSVTGTIIASSQGTR